MTGSRRTARQHGSGRHGRRGLAGALAVVTALLLALVPASTALADPANPANPTDQDVQAAKKAVATKVDEVARIELLLAQQSTISDAAWTKVEAAGEAYTRAEVARDAAAQTATETAARYQAASADMEKARKLLVGIAVQSSRNGASMDMAEAVLVSGGVQEVVARTTALDRVGTKADEAAQTFKASKLVADTLKKRADQALAASDAAATDAQAALVAAQQAQTDAEAAVAAATAQRETLVTQLAAARQTSVAVERARQDQIDAERAARANAAAEAARRAQTPTTPTTPTTGGTTNPPSPGTPSSSTPPAATTPGTPSTPSTPSAPSTPGAYGLGTGISRGSAAQGAAAVAWAATKLGLPYGWGATGPGSYDCSGLTMRAWQAAGLGLNRTTRDQYKQVLKISYNDLRPGDLVFWGSNGSDPSSITHVALWLGGNQILEAPRTGLPVRITSMRWTGTMPFAGRP